MSRIIELVSVNGGRRRIMIHGSRHGDMPDRWVE